MQTAEELRAEIVRLNEALAKCQFVSDGRAHHAKNRLHEKAKQLLDGCMPDSSGLSRYMCESEIRGLRDQWNRLELGPLPTSLERC